MGAVHPHTLCSGALSISRGAETGAPPISPLFQQPAGAQAEIAGTILP